MAASDLTPDLQRLLDRAAACREQGNWPEAIALDRQAIQLAPDSALAYGSLAQSLRGADRRPAAVQAWNQAIAQGLPQPSQTANAHWELGKLQWELGEHNGAIEQFLNAIALNPTLISLQTLDDLSRWLRRRDRPTEAAAFEQAALKRLIPEVRQLIHQGNAALAARWCLRVLRIAPDSHAPHNLLFEAFTALDRHEEARSCLYRSIPDALLDEFIPDLLCSIERLPLIDNTENGIEQLVEWPISDSSEIPEPRPILADHNVTTFAPLGPLGQFPRHCWAIEQGRVWVDSCNRVFWNRDGAVIDGLSIGAERLITTSNQLSHPQYIAGTVAVIAKQNTNNYFHWVTEFLPQVIDLLEFSKSIGQTIDYWYFHGESLPFQIQSLEALGISEKNCISSQFINHLAADTILTFNFLGIIECHSRSLHKLRDWLLPRNNLNSYPSKRLYLSRSRARRVLNENELHPILEKFNFEYVSEGLSFTEQVDLFSQAEVIVGPHGAAFTNMIWCQKSVKILEFFAPSYVNQCYWRMSHQLGFQYYYLPGNTVLNNSHPSLSQISFYHNLTLSPPTLVQALEHCFNSNESYNCT